MTYSTSCKNIVGKTWEKFFIMGRNRLGRVKGVRPEKSIFMNFSQNLLLDAVFDSLSRESQKKIKISLCVPDNLSQTAIFEVLE